MSQKRNLARPYLFGYTLLIIPQAVPAKGTEFNDHNGLGRKVRRRKSGDLLRPVFHTTCPAGRRTASWILPVLFDRMPIGVRCEE